MRNKLQAMNPARLLINENPKYGYSGKGNNGKPSDPGDYKGYEPQKAYAALVAMLMGPRLELKRGGETYKIGPNEHSQGVVAELTLPMFEVGKTQVDIRVTRQEDLFGMDQLSGYSKQEPVKPIKILQIRDANSGVVTHVQYFFEPQPLKADYNVLIDSEFRAKVL